jgi:hypothetical protein
MAHDVGETKRMGLSKKEGIALHFFKELDSIRGLPKIQFERDGDGQDRLELALFCISHNLAKLAVQRPPIFCLLP